LKELVGQSSLFKKKVKKKKKPDSSINTSFLEFTPAKRDTGLKYSLKSLNEEQLTAATSDSRYIVVTAGPGTGKTYTLVARVEKLIKEKKIKPDDITAITFTNRAAEEMKERLESVNGLDVEKLFIGTFHAFCLDLLREDEHDLTVIDETDRDKIISRLFPGLSSHEIRETKERIEMYYQFLAYGSWQHDEEILNAHIGVYLKELQRRNGIDLSGVIPRVVYRLKTEESFLNRVSSTVKYLFIDEFQDLNSPQYELVRTLAINSSVFAIGDPDQAIYGFRGSSPEFFHQFIEEFDAETIGLGKNYRSAKMILQAAGSVIENNYDSDAKYSTKLTAENSNYGNIELYQAASPQAEAEFVVRRIEELMGGISHFSIDTGRTSENAHGPERSFKDFSVLYRLTQQAQFLREALERRGIPFQVVNVKPFFMHKEVRSAYYWICAAGSESNDIEAETFLELLRIFPGVGESTLVLLENQLPFGGFSDFFAQAAEINIPKALSDRVHDLQQNLIDFRKNLSEKGLSGALKESMDYLKVNAKNKDAKRFLELAGSFGSDLPGFAAYLHKNEAATVYDEKAEAVSLMTIHGAKGLEFPVVFITGMEEGIFPCRLHGDEKKDDAAIGATASIQEERRLFYVGMTRARNSLILTSSVTRPIFGSYQSRPVSRFVNEIPESLYEQIKQDRPMKKKSGAKQMKLF
jgi:superfamily I DNA/RNA helicase